MPKRSDSAEEKPKVLASYTAKLDDAQMKKLGALLEVATARGLHTVIAGITADNAPSLRLHERLGYQRVGVVRECGWKFERWLDLVFLQKLLRSGPPG